MANAMACSSCQQARSNLTSAIKAASTGNVRLVATHLSETASALSEKAESLRIRGMLRQR